MEEKKIDNRIIEVKKQINYAEEKLIDSRKKLRGIEELEDNFSHLNKNLNICIELLNTSVKNKNVNKKIDYMNESNIVGYMKTSSTLYEEKELAEKEINKLNDEIDKLTDEIKEIYKENEENEEKEENKE